MIIKPRVNQYYNVNDTEYKFVKGENLGCGYCDLYKKLKTRGDCVFECNYGHMEEQYKSAFIYCPYCNAIIDYPIYTKGGTMCNSCDRMFQVKCIGD